jgi:hypothetical protein
MLYYKNQNKLINNQPSTSFEELWLYLITNNINIVIDPIIPQPINKLINTGIIFNTSNAPIINEFISKINSDEFVVFIEGDIGFRCDKNDVLNFFTKHYSVQTYGLGMFNTIIKDKNSDHIIYLDSDSHVIKTNF